MVILMNTHSIHFYGEIWEIMLKISNIRLYICFSTSFPLIQYCDNDKFSDRQVFANSVDPDQYAPDPYAS